MHALPLDLEEPDFLITRTNGLMLDIPSSIKSVPQPAIITLSSPIISTKPKNEVTFFHLPPEIRLQIYNLVLKHILPIQRPYTFNCKGRIFLSLLQVNRQIYWETRLLPFKLNIFDFEKWTGTGIYYCQLFMHKLAPWQIREIRHITLSVVELNMTREQAEGGWAELCKTLAGQEEGGCRLKSMTLTFGGAMFSHGRHLLDVNARWVTDGLARLSGLQQFEMSIASDGTDKSLVEKFSAGLEEVLQKTRVVVNIAERGLMCAIM